MKKSPKSLSFVDFKKIQGKRPLFIKRGRFFNLAYFSGDTMRFSFIVSKKKTKLAVSRNKIKRRSKACLFKVLQTKNTPKKGFYIFSVNTSSVEKEKYKEILKEIEVLLI